MYREMQQVTKLTDGCPLCKAPACVDRDVAGVTLVVCSTCGKFRSSLDVYNYLAGLEAAHDRRRYKLSHAMRTISERALGHRDNSFFPIYSSNDFERILDRPDLPIQEKLQALLAYLGSVSEFPGQTAEFDFEHDYTVFGAKNPEEASFYMRSLEGQRLLSLEEITLGTTTLPFTLSADGWLELDRIAQLGGESFNAFIAMWFDLSRSAFEEAMNRAIANAGYIPVRIDRVEHLNRIDDEIIARIRQSKFLIADFTGQRTGVYFEAGFMLGLGRPVIWVCEKTDLVNVHFDTRQYNMIDYSDADDLRSRLQFRIEANIGKGPHTITKG
jgi:hypothetical protein